MPLRYCVVERLSVIGIFTILLYTPNRKNDQILRFDPREGLNSR
jgi:hypothetical protein